NLFSKRFLAAGGKVLILAGRHDSTYGKLFEMAKRLNIASSVRFPGRIEDIAQLLALTDAAVLSSVSEGCPNVVLEYMVAGLPVAATDIAAARELLGADYSFLAPKKDPRALAEKILELYDSPELRKEVGRRNLERAETLFTPEKIFGRFAAVLKEYRMSEKDNNYFKIREGTESKGGVLDKPTVPRPSTPPKGQGGKNTAPKPKK
ncbi:MAG: glycosyltransferase family 4 protein, partial [Candidatus Aminicenantes bacterium]|nr:glycosyltransferase family 4 protein [Candidatus Aminicenantes bacterium]